MVAYIYLLKIKGIRKQVMKYIYKIKNMSASGKEIQWPEMLQQKFSSRHRELDIISWFDFINDY